MPLVTLPTSTVVEYAVQSFLETIQAAPESAGLRFLLSQAERAEEYTQGEVIVEMGEIMNETHRNAGYITSQLTQTDVYPLGEQKVEEIYARRVHMELSFRCLARYMRGLLRMRGQLEDYLEGYADLAATEYSPDRFSIGVKDYSTNASGDPTDIKLFWRYPTKASTWNVVQVPGEQLMNGILTVSLFVDVLFVKEYNQILKFTEDIYFLTPNPPAPITFDLPLTPGPAVPLAADTPCLSVTMKNLATNTDVLFLGSPTSQTYSLGIGLETTRMVRNLNEIYALASATPVTLRITYTPTS